METALALLRLALERGWTLGLLFVVFCGGSLLAPRFTELELPEPIRQWSGAGLLFGAAVILVSAASNLAGFIGRLLKARGQRRADAADREAEDRHVVANLQALGAEDAQVLERLLSSGAARFEVHILSDSYRLLQLGFLTIVRRMGGGTSWICELHSALTPLREQFKKRNPQAGRSEDR